MAYESKDAYREEALEIALRNLLQAVKRVETEVKERDEPTPDCISNLEAAYKSGSKLLGETP